jgi:peptidoglycan hydrolase-like protein with peptidoglycan-binding domain
VPTTDLASPGPWIDARRRSRARRAATARRARRLRLSRGGLSALLAGMTLIAGAAIAQGQAQTSSSSSARPGSSVAALQRALGVPADGVYGPQTAAAVRAFQQRQGLVVDGVAGPATLRALGLAGAATAAPAAQTGGSTSSAALQRIAQCESGGDPTAVSASGTYRGKYQFSRETWSELGGSGDPAAASEAEQDRLAAKLYAQRGAAPWPVCGR